MSSLCFYVKDKEAASQWVHHLSLAGCLKSEALISSLQSPADNISNANAKTTTATTASAATAAATTTAAADNVSIDAFTTDCDSEKQV
ncbi:hypothetical protein HELRODRAFT_195160 [Helobdella robusta]|uniref:PH domain-containing protein n=1 Tax=Helobdella robusta TaxID=6412 RepID=T1FWT9_HELRO|nr:hypothetical protein HELRODRAFT_195160 [Helobdella robusta]ESN97634.1 hypothetical protein HELRODRAFT_195160 [Helobdella robusta]